MNNPLDLRHYSAEPIEELSEKVIGRQNPFKPRGLWVSVEGGGDGWKGWCEQQQFELDSLAYEYRVLLDYRSRVLFLHTQLELEGFTELYQTDRIMGVREIDWVRVAEKYQGIIITPYLWSCRLNPQTFWYYGWDCASGCIWDVRAISGLTLL